MKRLLGYIIGFLALLVAFVLVIIYYRQAIFALLLRVRQPSNRHIKRETFAVEMPDGVKLATDVYLPDSANKYPTILLRTPYGRGGNQSLFGFFEQTMMWRFAERGYCVVIQDTRGRFDSSGAFEPYFHERTDGLATLEWITQQAWYDGNIGMWGASYSGIVQWAVAPFTDKVQAYMPMVTASHLQNILAPDDSFDLGLSLRWLVLFKLLDDHRDQPLWRSTLALPKLQKMEERVLDSLLNLPLRDLDRQVLGNTAPQYQTWMDNSDPYSELWQSQFADVDITQVNAPVFLIAGWYDFFLREQLKDYQELRDNGKEVYLTIGPWHHFQAVLGRVDLKAGIHWFDEHLKGESTTIREKPVRIHLMGTLQWLEMESFPPPSEPRYFYLQPDNSLKATAPVQENSQTEYVYDPSDPTPYVGGTQFKLTAGRVENSELEARDDVIVFTSEPLPQHMDVIGYVRLQVYVKSSLNHADFFGRLCDVNQQGESHNICDGLFRIKPGNVQPDEDGVICLEIDMWATAYRFKAGHRIRLQVSSGAHPRWVRNPGVADIVDTLEVKTAHQTIYHDAQHPSALILPIFGD